MLQALDKDAAIRVAQTKESLLQACQAGELITSLGSHPSLGIGPLLETYRHDIGDILREPLVHEDEALKAYDELLDCPRNRDVRLEEYARMLMAEEPTHHQGEVNKILGDAGPNPYLYR
jgi:bacterioferritin